MSKRADIIKEKVSIFDVLSKYGYDIKSGYHVEQQFACDLHGDTRDSKPSARVYPESNSWYCFACGKARDVIETVRDKESCDFNKACYKIEEDYGLPHYIQREEDRIDIVGPMDRISVKVTEPIDSIRSQVERILRISFVEKSMNPMDVVRMWELYDMVVFHLEEGKWPEDECRIRFSKIKDKVMSIISNGLNSDS